MQTEKVKLKWYSIMQDPLQSAGSEVVYMMSEEVVQVYKYPSYGDIHYENYSDAIVVKQESCMQINGRF